jgi:nucleoside-diphosphate-sugar epimerase
VSRYDLFNPGKRQMHLETRILITGGAGFLGSHLCERLLNEGADIICLESAESSRLGAAHIAQGGACEDDRLFRDAARAAARQGDANRWQGSLD